MRSDLSAATIETGDPLGQWEDAPSEWQQKKLWDLADFINGRAFKPTDFTPDGLRVIKITELKHGVSDDTALYDGPYDDKHLLQNEDVLFAWSGNPETSLDAFRWTDGQALLNQHIFRVLPCDGIDRTYLYFLLKFIRPTFIRTARDKATSMGHVKVSDLKRLIACIPPTLEQQAITSILRALDDKIELNRRMNETLEAMARALFQNRFVDATQAGLPKGWRESTLGELIELAYGKALKAEDRQPGEIPVFGSNGQVGWHNEKLVQGPGIVVGRKGNPGIVTWSPTDFFPIDTTFYVVPRGECRSLYFLYYALRAHNLAALGADSAVPGLNRNMAYLSEQVAPPSDVLEKFDGIVKPLFDKIHANDEESRTLAALRDALLPKLLSGKLRIAPAKHFSTGETVGRS